MSVTDRLAVPAIHRRSSPALAFWSSWAGWMLDGFDSAIYQFVLVSALIELLPLSGMEASRGNVAFYGGLLFSVFMLGWAASMFWGWLADKIGRVTVMCMTILFYSLFTALCGLSWGLVSFGIFRFLAGFGIGGEWAAGTPLLHESVPEHMRVRLAGWLHTATPTGILLASVVALVALPTVGWRGMFFLGLAPALLAFILRRYLAEPVRQRKANARGLFTGQQARTTWAAALMMSCAIFGLWSSTFWIPTVVITKLTGQGAPLAHAQVMAAWSGVLVNVGTLAGCLVMPFAVRWIGGRKRSAVVFFTGSLLVNMLAYFWVVPRAADVTAFFAVLPLLGFFTNGIFALFTIWLPELFPGVLRGFGSGFAFSFGRLLGATGPTVVGSLAAVLGSFPLAIGCVSVIYLLALPCVALARETGDRPLQA